MKKLNNKGFSLVELLGIMVILSLILGITFYSVKNTFSIAEGEIQKIQDNEVEDAVRSYIIENNVLFNNFGYTCIDASDLVEFGYLSSGSYDDNIIRVEIDLDTYVITDVMYDSECR